MKHKACSLNFALRNTETNKKKKQTSKQKKKKKNDAPQQRTSKGETSTGKKSFFGDSTSEVLHLSVAEKETKPWTLRVKNTSSEVHPPLHHTQTHTEEQMHIR